MYAGFYPHPPPALRHRRRHRNGTAPQRLGKTSPEPSGVKKPCTSSPTGSTTKAPTESTSSRPSTVRTIPPTVGRPPLRPDPKPHRPVTDPATGEHYDPTRHPYNVMILGPRHSRQGTAQDLHPGQPTPPTLHPLKNFYALTSTESSKAPTTSCPTNTAPPSGSWSILETESNNTTQP